MMFDPWTATFEEATSAQRDWEAAGGGTTSPLGPIFQANSAKQVLTMRSEIDSGNGRAVLQAIGIVVLHGLIAPDWLASAYLQRLRAVTHADVGSWDDQKAFGRPYPKGTNLAATKKASVGRLAVWVDVKNHMAKFPDTPIDKGLFELIGKPLGFGVTLTEEYYYAAKRTYGRLFGPVIRANPAKLKKTAGLRRRKR